MKTEEYPKDSGGGRINSTTKGIWGSASETGLSHPNGKGHLKRGNYEN